MKFFFVLILYLSILATKSEAQTKSKDSIVYHTETQGKTYKVWATVKKIYLEEKKITLKHQKIKGYMPAMTMTFPVSKASLLDNLVEGRKGIFTIFVYKGLPKVVGIKLSSLIKRKSIQK